ncbi:tetratricopeptide repeat protein [Christiangramia aquimixticola]|uniref:type IX secretion system periplasmic lipoprotein PorW/SprE n=1 Tax=Christiangramia aquimixticola TaxID=1697558 RepID=UPI003AA874C9
MNTFTRYILFLLASVSIIACSRKKDTFVNRNFHAVTAEYNILYNGQVAYEQGREEISQNYADNYWDLLPVERLAVDDKILLPDSVRNQNFGRAEEKAVKAIQKHSMQISGKERNPQMDEAYLLLGKSRYFDQRFVPALDAFNYILYRYPASNNITHARIWREKTNIRLGNEKLAVKNLKKILESSRLDKKDIADASASLAQAYVNLNHLDSAAVSLTKTAEFTAEDSEKGRYFYILGQLNNRLGKPAVANNFFDKVIDLKRKSPRIYYVNAYVQKARNYDLDSGDPQFLLNVLTELEQDRENRPYLDKIYFQLGEYYKNIDSLEIATAYYNKSLASPSSDIFLKSINYEILANLSFDAAEYQTAGKYYDSTLTYMSPELLEFRTIKKKRENLENVIRFERIAEETDSILMLADMSSDQLLEYFTKYTDTLKATAVKEMEAGELPVYTSGIGPRTNFPSAGVPPAGDITTGNAGNVFYFYNPIRVSKGAQEFIKTWGSRPLADNWRWSTRAMNQSTVNAQERLMEVNFDNDPVYDPLTYVSQVPKDEITLDSLVKQRNEAYYQLGIIYHENYREYALAAERFEFLLENDPEERFILPAKYNLYNIYGAQGRIRDQETMKMDILENYPDSRFAIFIKNPEAVTVSKNEPEILYQNLYKQFEEQEYSLVIEGGQELIDKYPGDPVIPKVELLIAQATARLYGLEAYTEALGKLASNYSQTEEGQKAQSLLNKGIPQLKTLEFSKDSLQNNYKLVYPVQADESEKETEIKNVITKAIAELGYGNLKVSVDIYDPAQKFIVVHGLTGKDRAQGFRELLLNNKNYKLDREAFVISSENYRIVQIKKNLRNFLELN